MQLFCVEIIEIYIALCYHACLSIACLDNSFMFLLLWWAFYINLLNTELFQEAYIHVFLFHISPNLNYTGTSAEEVEILMLHTNLYVWRSHAQSFNS